MLRDSMHAPRLPKSLDGATEYLKYRKKSFLSGVFKCVAEYKQFHIAKSSLQQNYPKGDGHPVLVIPAFTSNDWPTSPLRRALKRQGYKAYAWKGGLNLGITEETMKHVHTRLKKIYEENGNRKVTIIGHSLGGFYARALAQEFPEMVRAVVTIHTPFGVGLHKDVIPPQVIKKIQDLSDPKYSLENGDVTERLLTPPPVPTTSIFSKIDAVAGWQACLNPLTRLSENIEVQASHLGSVWHKGTIEVILDRLAQPEGKWKPHKNPANDVGPANPNWKLSPFKSFFPKR